jgi:Flp pilus assembly protein TadB
MAVIIARILSALVGLAFVVLTFIFASLIVAIAVAAGLLLWAWAWWRGRGLRRHQRQVIEGEYRIIDQR